MTFFDNGAASIGIIGGADGPTAIFLAGDMQHMALSLLAAAAVLVTVIVLLCRKKKK